jgi:hypothetical protein
MSQVQLREHLLEGQWRPECVICKESVMLEESKANEYGQSVHEECYVSGLVGNQLKLLASTGMARGAYVFRWALTLASKRGKQRGGRTA